MEKWGNIWFIDLLQSKLSEFNRSVSSVQEMCGDVSEYLTKMENYLGIYKMSFLSIAVHKKDYLFESKQ